MVFMTTQSLDSADIGQLLRIADIPEPAVESQLIRMGLSVGDLVTCLSRLPAGGPTVVRRGSLEIALGQGLAQQIQVEGL
jgi:Fe2+ transport system protein FeoA